MPHVVSVLATEGAGLFELAIVAEVFGLPRPEVEGWDYELRVCAASGHPVATAGGLSLSAAHGLDALAAADTVIVPSCGDVQAAVPEAVVAAVRAAHARGARLVSICSGAFVLAAAGLLDGRRVSTHWRYAELLAERHPRVVVDPHVLYLGDERVMTAAGSSAGVDACLELVRRDLGSAAANVVARRMVMPPHRDGGQAQFIELPVPVRAQDVRLAAAMDWALARIDQPLSVEAIASEAYMSVRTFTRRFREATGTSPGRWLLEQRVRASLALLESSDDPVETVAARVGFATPGTFRHHFGALMRTSPSSYRRAFQTRSAA